MKIYKLSLIALFMIAGYQGSIMAGTSQQQAPAVVELFTSQSCYSCPPAEKLLGKLIEEHPEIVALEFHVDYWDELVYGDAGKWKDRFSSPEYTLRQRQYNKTRPKGRPGVYTPQMLVNGDYTLVGSDQNRLYQAISRPFEPRASLNAQSADDGWKISVTGESADQVDIWLASFLIRAETPVKAGENKDKFLVNHHVVTNMTRIGEWKSGDMEKVMPAVKNGENQGCAILLQDKRGRIMSAVYCPEA